VIFVNATDFKNNLGQYFIKMYQKRIIITKMGRPTAVLLSYDEYEKLLKEKEEKKQDSEKQLYGPEKEQALMAIRDELHQMKIRDRGAKGDGNKK